MRSHTQILAVASMCLIAATSAAIAQRAPAAPQSAPTVSVRPLDKATAARILTFMGYEKVVVGVIVQGFRKDGGDGGVSVTWVLALGVRGGRRSEISEQFFYDSTLGWVFFQTNGDDGPIRIWSAAGYSEVNQVPELEGVSSKAASPASQPVSGAAQRVVLGTLADSVLEWRGRAIGTRQIGKDKEGLLVEWEYPDAVYVMGRRLSAGVEAYRVVKIMPKP